MAKTMRAAVVRAFREPLTIEERPIPTPGPGEVLVQVVASGVCHTDLHAANGDWPVKPTLPFVPGHEGAGIVAAVGAARHAPEGRRPGRRRMAPRRVRRVRALYRRLGDTLRGAAQQRLRRRRRVRRVRARRGGRTSPGCPIASDFAAMAPILCAGVTTYKGIKETEARPGSGSRSRDSADSAISPCSTPRRMGLPRRRARRD
jgi:propanol-preferring alcohol dehydrogenase